MGENIVVDDKNKEAVLVYEFEDANFEDPVRHYRERAISSGVSRRKMAFLLKKIPITQSILERLAEEAKREWDNYFRKAIRAKVPEPLLTLLKNDNSKREQEKLLKGLALTPEQLYAFTFRAWIEYGLTFSEYSAEHMHSGLNEEDLPRLIRVDNTGVHKMGKTPLSDGQLRNVIQHRKKTISKFYDKDGIWHCLFTTYQSLKGEENWKNGQPHFHYLSDKFGIARDEAIRQLQSKYYKLGNLPHIEYLDHREQ